VHATDDEIAQVAAAIRDAGIGRVYTGHCTGAHALELLQRALPGCIADLCPGLQTALP
jgi:metal-dependent hydrolase (beta-lactamase superfamily II)